MCETLIPKKHSWTNETLTHIPSENYSFKNANKLWEQMGMKLYIAIPEIELSLRLPDPKIVFKTEDPAITECVNWLKANTGPTTGNISIDS